ncbi:hypothetical protein BDAP_002477 [Binucleata daphniae]
MDYVIKLPHFSVVLYPKKIAMENNKENADEEKSKVLELKAKLEDKIKPEHILNVKYSEQNFYGQLQDMLMNKKNKDKKDDKS